MSATQLQNFDAAATNAHRIGTAHGGWVERFGEDLLISYKDDAGRDALLARLGEWSTQCGFAARRTFEKRLPIQSEERVAPMLLAGDPALPLETVVQENGMRFGIDFGAGYSAGLFLDQRHNRALVRRTSAARVLNTFAYTCSFSVAAALAGSQTLSVDLSKKSLDRGRANFDLNGIAAAGHHFLADDVLDLLPRLARRGERFDCIILDPPTFSRGNRGQRFQVERNLGDLLHAALEVAAPRARVLLSTNCTRLALRDLEALARFALKANRLSASFHREPSQAELPPTEGAQTLWLFLK